MKNPQKPDYPAGIACSIFTTGVKHNQALLVADRKKRQTAFACVKWPQVFYFFLKYISTGTPEKSKFSRSLFSTKRLYGSFMYCGRLAKNANLGVCVGSCVQNLIFMYLPLVAGGGVDSMMGSITSFNSRVFMRRMRLWYTCTAVSMALNIRCFSSADMNTIGTSVNGAIFSRIFFSNSREVLLPFSTRSHLFTSITMPLPLRSAR